jgi:hypothetical protein
MAIGDKTYPWAMHTAWGYLANTLQNVIETTGGYTNNKKIVSAATAGAVLSSTAGTTAIQTITAGITNPDVPRVLAITIGGSGMSAGSILINGVNVEGKPITDTVGFTTTGQVQGVLVFKRVTSIVIPTALSTTGTVTIDTTNKLGLNQRLVPNYSTIVCLSATLTTPYTDHTTTSFRTNLPIVEAAVSSSNIDGEFVEKNWVTPATAPNGTTYLFFFYWFYKVLVYPPKDSPEFYSTTTSTSLSTSSTSTSSTSVSTSTSVSSTSVSTTSISTSSTSTSTTTLPV